MLGTSQEKEMPQGPMDSRPGAYGYTDRASEGPQERFPLLHVQLRTSYLIGRPSKMKENKIKKWGSNVELHPAQASALAPSLTALNDQESCDNGCRISLHLRPF